MPTVLRFEAYRVVVYPNDHRPAHVHVFGAGNEAVFDLSHLVGPVELRENYGFSRREIARIRAALNASVETLWAEWRAIHGDA